MPAKVSVVERYCEYFCKARCSYLQYLFFYAWNAPILLVCSLFAQFQESIVQHLYLFISIIERSRFPLIVTAWWVSWNNIIYQNPSSSKNSECVAVPDILPVYHHLRYNKSACFRTTTFYRKQNTYLFKWQVASIYCHDSTHIDIWVPSHHKV